MVPDPSIMLPPMPFIDVVTGWEVVEYMAPEDDTAAGSSGEEENERDAPKRPSRSSRAGGGQQRTAGGGRRKRSLQLERFAALVSSSRGVDGQRRVGVSHAAQAGKGAND